MSLPVKFRRRLWDSMRLHPVWLPGESLVPGDVLSYRGGVLSKVSSLKSFGVAFTTQRALETGGVCMQARGVSMHVTQAGARVRPAELDLDAHAELEVGFRRADTYFIRTPSLTGESISDLLEVGKQLRCHSTWDCRRFFLASTVYTAEGFTFLGSLNAGSAIRFAGRGKAISGFLLAGGAAGVSSRSATGIAVEIIGGKGPVAMRAVRFRRDGSLW